ncbi:MAG: protein arginine kinase [Candidatus Omnitrophica bacterium]|nr:protein arginine kinase [Candidatus Omnitrophota bacterium]
MFENFLTNQDSWLNGKGPSSEIVFSSRVRLARNIADAVFPSRASVVVKETIRSRAEEVYQKVKSLERSVFVKMEELDELDRQFLLERHLISQEHTVSPKGKGLIVSNDERIALMVNEEDHLRMQVVTSGFDLAHCWSVLNEIDTELGGMLDFAFLPDLGYLTSCPTNAGTALRASCMLHIPALVLTKRINKILELLVKISFTARGLFGEGTQALGDFFQISNQGSLGLTEEELIDNLSGVVNQVKEQEIDARESLLKKYKFSLEDNVWRAFGVLKNCRLIGSKEALSHLSMLSLGLDLGIIKGIRRELINSLFIIIQPAHLQKIEGKPLKEEERDYIRASILRERLVFSA